MRKTRSQKDGTVSSNAENGDPSVPPNSASAGKTIFNIPVPDLLPLLTIPNQAATINDDNKAKKSGDLAETEESKEPDRIDLMLTQLNMLTSTTNTMNSHFAAVKNEFVLVNTTLNEIKDNQRNIQSNKEDIEVLENKVGEIEASITFNDFE